MVQKNKDIETIKQALEYTDGNISKAIEYINKDLNYPIKGNRVRYLIYQNNIPFNNRNKVNASPEELYESYKELKSLRKVGKKFNCSADGVKHILKKHGYPIRELKKYTFDKGFFKQETEASFYWAGFIAADGCVKSRKMKNSSHTLLELQIGLSKKDKSHIEKFKSDISYDGPIRDYLIKNSKRNKKWNDSEKSEITITINDEVMSNLEKFNIVPRKSLTYTFPEWLIGHKLVNHFMRGYFDGDGSVYYNLGKNRNVTQKFISIRGTQEFLTTYRKVLENNCDLKERKKEVRKNNGIGVLEYGGNGVSESIFNYLYKDSTIYLDRKYSKFTD